MNESATSIAWIGQSITFATAHLYALKNWDTARNQAAFGACFTDFGHGHNYRLEVRVPSEQVSASRLREALSLVGQHFDHRHLSFDDPTYSGREKVPTTENIAMDCVAILAQALNMPQELVQVRLWEMDNLAVTVGDW